MEKRSKKVQDFAPLEGFERTSELVVQAHLGDEKRLAIGFRPGKEHDFSGIRNLVFFSQFEGVVGIYPLNPAAVRSYCRSFALSNAHSDRTDAAMIAATHSIIMVNCGRSNAPAARCATCAAWSSIGAPS